MHRHRNARGPRRARKTRRRQEHAVRRSSGGAPSGRHPFWDDLAAGRVRPKRRIDYDEETGEHTIQVRQGDGSWSQPKVVQPEVVEEERQRNPRWPEMELGVRVALAGLRRAERHAQRARLRAVRTILPPLRSRAPRGGAKSRPGARRPSCRPRAPSDDPGSEPGEPPRHCAARGHASLTFSAADAEAPPSWAGRPPGAGRRP
jgi:hypothetical protein